MLDNPIWNSLRVRHAALALSKGVALRYPPEVAPFVGVPDEGEQSRCDLMKLVKSGETVGILNIIPALTDGWDLLKEIEIYQYAWPRGREAESWDGATKLGEEHIPAMLELTALVYPAYFRAETARLGDYYGVLDRGKLCAMAGIRMAMDGYQEISAICTHPDHRGKGFASQLTKHLIHQIGRDGDIAFLHTESDNTAARSIYEREGFDLRAKLPFKIYTRA